MIRHLPLFINRKRREELKFTLARDALLRKEWFGCLVYIPFWPGIYQQFNHDAYQILRLLGQPIDDIRLLKSLHQSDVDIEQQDLTEFLILLHDQGIIVDSDVALGTRSFYDKKTEFRHDCLVAPTSTTIYITERCTKQCRHCVVRSSPNVDTAGEMNVSEWKTALGMLHDFGVCSLVFTGGEPFLKDGILEILSAADVMKFGITLLTDYDGMNSSHVEFLKGLDHLLDVQVSLDGANATTHEYLRGSGSFDNAIRRLELLGESGLRYTISFTAHRGNVAEIDGVVELYHRYNASYLYINPLAPYGRAKETMRDQIFDDVELGWLAHKYLDVVRHHDVNSGNPYWQYVAEEDKGDEFHPFRGALTAVSIGTYNLSLDCRGECHLDSKMKSEGMLRLGNVLRDSMDSIWYNPVIDQLRDHYSPDEFSYVDQSVVRI